MFCKYCGQEIENNANFCSHCGRETDNNVFGDSSDIYEKYKNAAKDAAKNSSEFTKKAMETITGKINEMTGGEGAVDLRLKDLVSEVLKKHTHEEAEDIFICGTSRTTPKEENISTFWPKPWLYTRVGLVLAAATLLIFFCCNIFQNSNALPGFMVLGSFLMPIVVLIFFFEVNAPRNISFYEVIGIFLVGGCASLLVTLFFFELFPKSGIELVLAIAIGVIEESGKAVIVGIIIKQSKKCRYVLNGLLIGGAVGAGFAAFESAGYAFNTLLSTGSFEAMLDVIIIRGILAPGGHVAWAAITGAAIMLSIDKDTRSWDFFKDKKFYSLFLISVTLHAIWDYLTTYFVLTVLIIMAWIVILVLINTGMKEINKISGGILPDSLKLPPYMQDSETGSH
ncbi:MAG: PrsW family intramembrane metalloprotease [Eubacterium sp.]|nr:PrsW family intramembrane metalloprotease [Eubacterium sp.]